MPSTSSQWLFSENGGRGGRPTADRRAAVPQQTTTSPPPNEMDDSPLAQLLARVALHDRRAFMQLYDATHRHLFALAVRLMGNPQAAEDVLQDAFLRVWHNAGQYNASVAKPMTWLINVVRNRAIDVLRSGRTARESTQPLDDELAEDLHDMHSATPESDLNKSLLKSRVGRCMVSLNGQQRQAIALTYFQGWQHQQIAESMSVPLSTAKSWVRRGLNQLKACLESTGVRSAE